MTRIFRHARLLACGALVGLPGVALPGAVLPGAGDAAGAEAGEPAGLEVAATGTPPGPAREAPPPEQVRALVELLGDPELRDWLRGRLAEPPTRADVMGAAPAGVGAMGMAERRLETVRGQLRAMAAAIPRLPAALAAAWATLKRDLSETGIVWAILLVGGFVGLGFGAQGLYWLLTGRALRHIVGLPMDTVHARVGATLKRFGWGLGWLLAFALGSVGAFLLFEWPPVLRTVVLAYLIAFLGLRLALVLGRFQGNLQQPPDDAPRRSRSDDPRGVAAPAHGPGADGDLLRGVHRTRTRSCASTTPPAKRRAPSCARSTATSTGSCRRSWTARPHARSGTGWPRWRRARRCSKLSSRERRR